jgi:hypothetical protein
LQSVKEIGLNYLLAFLTCTGFGGKAGYDGVFVVCGWMKTRQE